MTDRVDPAAFRSAYNALMPFIPLAQVRAEVAEMVTRAVVERRTQHGLGYMLELAQTQQSRQPVVDEVKGALPEMFTSAHPAFIDKAVRGAARALWDGSEAVAVISHDDRGRLTPESTVTVGSRTVPIAAQSVVAHAWGDRVNAALMQLGYRLPDDWEAVMQQAVHRTQVEVLPLTD